MTDVLNHGFVNLIDSMGNDLAIVRAARVSYDAAWRAGDDEKSDEKLIRYLMKNKHTTPFEAVEFQFEVMAPIFVLRQWHRHRTASINELSARYRELPEVYYVPDPKNIGIQSKDSKQARTIPKYEDQHDLGQANVIADIINHQCRETFKTYKLLLQNEVPREIARGVLPLNTYSHMFWKCNLHNLFHFLELRCHPHAQYEIRVYAEAMLELIRPVVPVAAQAWSDLMLLSYNK